MSTEVEFLHGDNFAHAKDLHAPKGFAEDDVDTVKQWYDTETHDGNKKSALHWAVWYGSTNVINALLDWGADPTIRNSRGDHLLINYITWLGNPVDPATVDRIVSHGGFWNRELAEAFVRCGYLTPEQIGTKLGGYEEVKRSDVQLLTSKYTHPKDVAPVIMHAFDKVRAELGISDPQQTSE